MPNRASIIERVVAPFVDESSVSGRDTVKECVIKLLNDNAMEKRYL